MIHYRPPTYDNAIPDLRGVTTHMSTTAQTTTTTAAADRIADGAWRLDPARPSVAFHVRHFERHPQVRFVCDSAHLDGDTLRLRGQLHAAGREIPLGLDATVREIDGELEIEGVTEADHRDLAMTWSPLGILRAPSKLIVRGRLVRR